MDQIEVVEILSKNVIRKMWIPYIGDTSTRWPEYDDALRGRMFKLPGASCH